MKYLLFIVLIYSCASKKNDSVIVKEEEKQQDYMIVAFEEMMKTTSFTALIQDYKIETNPIEDSDKNDDFAEKIVLFSATVLETFNGKHQDDIIYEMIIDIDEDEILNKEPKLICLCQKNGTFFWQGTGSSFPNKQSLIDKANEIKKKGDSDNSNCVDN